MIVTAWNNGQHHTTGAGYGIKIVSLDRDHYFKREWASITLELEYWKKQVDVNIAKPSFWNDPCRELIHIEIGRWLIQKGLAP